MHEATAATTAVYRARRVTIAAATIVHHARSSAVHRAAVPGLTAESGRNGPRVHRAAPHQPVANDASAILAAAPAPAPPAATTEADGQAARHDAHDPSSGKS